MSSTKRNEEVDHHLTPCTNNIKPAIHITAPCWINDPCAPAYESTTRTYHLFYQCNATGGTEWGDMAWGHVTSKDLLTWKRSPNQPVLKADQKYDQAGVFTGCLIPPSRQESGNLTAFYSSVTKIPFHWTRPYPRNVAGIAIATSRDGGRTWRKSGNNPILQGEPERVEVTGYRDPYVSEWPELDDVRGKCDKCLYGLVAGGIKDIGPTLFFYEIHPSNHESWEYIGTFIDIPERYQLGNDWEVNFGMNFECTNFMTLHSHSTSRHFLIMGTEDDLEREHIKQHRLPSGLAPRTIRRQLWTSGDLLCVEGIPKFTLKTAGILDHGSYYAASSFFDISTDKRIVHGWIPEEDAPLSYHAAKGWNGVMALPREIFLLTLTHVTGTLQSSLLGMTCLEQHVESDGTTTVHTLGIRPIAELMSFPP